jgi:acetyl esterase/lipase
MRARAVCKSCYPLRSFPGRWRTLKHLSGSAVLLSLTLCFYSAAAQSTVTPTHRDIVYATVDGKELKLDLYLPAGRPNPMLLVWVHGGAWRTGSKDFVPKCFVENGIATASLDFRASTEGQFPAAVHDIKAAIRFLRAKAPEFGYKADRIGIAGNSSGGHLAALVGVTSNHTELEGTVGEYPNESSEVHAIIDYYGASNLTTILSQSTPHGLNVRKPALEFLLGGQPENVPELARLASPVFHVDKSDPPLLLIHGDQDIQMPINQAHELEGKYREQFLDVQLQVLYGAGHGGDAFFSGENAKLAVNFLRRTLQEGK